MLTQLKCTVLKVNNKTNKYEKHFKHAQCILWNTEDRAQGLKLNSSVSIPVTTLFKVV
jgi:hypothetical protein